MDNAAAQNLILVALRRGFESHRRQILFVKKFGINRATSQLDAHLAVKEVPKGNLFARLLIMPFNESPAK